MSVSAHTERADKRRGKRETVMIPVLLFLPLIDICVTKTTPINQLLLLQKEREGSMLPCSLSLWLFMFFSH
jgi:hypothetical protein